MALVVLLVFAVPATAGGNTSNDSFGKAKKALARVYTDYRITVYC